LPRSHMLMIGIVGVILATAVAANHRRQHADGASHHVARTASTWSSWQVTAASTFTRRLAVRKFRLVTAILMVGTCLGCATSGGPIAICRTSRYISAGPECKPIIWLPAQTDFMKYIAAKADTGAKRCIRR
jgi:hypothetical protein